MTQKKAIETAVQGLTNCSQNTYTVHDFIEAYNTLYRNVSKNLDERLQALVGTRLKSVIVQQKSCLYLFPKSESKSLSIVYKNLEESRRPAIYFQIFKSFMTCMKQLLLTTA